MVGRVLGQDGVQEKVSRLGHSGGITLVMSRKALGISPFLWLPGSQAGVHPSVCPSWVLTVSGTLLHPGQGTDAIAGDSTGAVSPLPGLRGREGSCPLGAASASAHGCPGHLGPWLLFPSWWQPCLHVSPHPAAGDPALSFPAGRPSRSHSTMSLSVRPQRRVLVTKINRSQSFAGVNSSGDRPFR